MSESVQFAIGWGMGGRGRITKLVTVQDILDGEPVQKIWAPRRRLKRQMKNKPVRQKSNWCTMACIESVLDEWDITLSQEKIFEIGGSNYFEAPGGLRSYTMLESLLKLCGLTKCTVSIESDLTKLKAHVGAGEAVLLFLDLPQGEERTKHVVRYIDDTEHPAVVKVMEPNDGDVGTYRLDWCKVDAAACIANT